MHRVLSIPIARFQSWFGAGPIWRRPFIRNAAVVIGGTAIAQAITMAFSPIITRLYSPEAFGLLGVFTSVISILTPIASLCYPYAIILPPRDEDGLRLVHLSMLIAVSMTVLVAAIIIPFRDWIASRLSLETSPECLLLVPVVMLLAALGHIFDQWLVRSKLFRVSSGIAIVQALAVNVGKTVLGFLAPGVEALVGLTSAGHGLHATMSAYSLFLARRAARPASVGRVLDPRTKVLLVEYRDYPQYRLPQILLNSVSKNLPVVMLAALFDPAVAGLYAVGQRVLKIPAIIMSDAIGRVFQQRIAQATHEGQSLRPLVIKATAGLAAIGIVPFSGVVLFGPAIFSLAFGADWVLAGEYARWLAFWLFFGFINVPSVAAVPFLSLQGKLLALEIITVIARIGALLAGALSLHSDIAAIAGFSVVGSLSYVMLIAYVIRESSRRSRVPLVSR